MKDLLKHQIVMFIVMVCVGTAFNPMNILASLQYSNKYFD